MKKNKKKNHGQEEIKKCSNCFKSRHIVFSFAYLTYKKDFGKREAEVFFNRMIELSNVNYLTLRKLQKSVGFEEERLEMKKEIPSEFEEDIEIFDGKYTVIRLYKNNIPTPGRIIGKLVNKVFYIFYIDVKGELYKH